MVFVTRGSLLADRRRAGRLTAYRAALEAYLPVLAGDILWLHQRRAKQGHSLAPARTHDGFRPMIEARRGGRVRPSYELRSTVEVVA